MVNMTLHGQNINIVLLADLANQLLKTDFYAVYQKYLSPIARTEHEMIVDH